MDDNFGDWKYYDIPSGIIKSNFLRFFVAFLFLFLGASVETIFYSRIVTYVGILLFRLYWVCRQMNFSFYDFLKSVILRSLFTIAISYIITLVICDKLQNLEKLLFSGISHIIVFVFINYFFCLSKMEQEKLKNLLKSLIK